MQLLRITFEEATFFHDNFSDKEFCSFYACYDLKNVRGCALDIPREKLNIFYICSPEEIAFKRNNSQIVFKTNSAF